MPARLLHYRSMQTRPLGNSDLNLTPLGYGAWAIGGGDWQFGWGPQDDQAAIDSIRAALELGVNWIDTAAVYGLGHSEELVARALEGVGSRPYVFTKCGLVWDETRQTQRRLRADSIRKECEASLRRLQVERLDLYQVHWPTEAPGEIEEGWTALAELQKAGKVRWLGVSNFSVAQMQRAQRIAPITSLQPPYSLLARDIEAEILPFCQRSGIGVIAYSPMASGLLSGAMTRQRIAGLPAGDWRRQNAQFQEPKLSQNLELAERLKQVGARQGKTAGEVAVAWTLRQPAVTAAIVGTRSAQQSREVFRNPTFRLTSAEVTEIESGAPTTHI